ncbi:MAG TPA: SMC-Scp complex subunit ScpB [Clostridiales bacterium]|nr:MAG: SMC-Scp complex subunit ScpB [Clostridiales bacterium GWD2_32_59]HAN09943.1 SMC-Scp complex subunit ScpB [Clostridiales bacterium]
MNDVHNIIEAILFVSGEAINVNNIAQAVGKDLNETKKIMIELVEKYNSDNRGLQIIQINDDFQLVTRPVYFENIAKIYQKIERPKITPALIETLAIIAYKQPITRNEIESIRGVKSDNVINKLIEYNLIEEMGRLEKIGRPLLFGTTDNFLRYFGFKSLQELPKVE